MTEEHEAALFKVVVEVGRDIDRKYDDEELDRDRDRDRDKDKDREWGGGYLSVPSFSPFRRSPSPGSDPRDSEVSLTPASSPSKRSSSSSFSHSPIHNKQDHRPSLSPPPLPLPLLLLLLIPIPREVETTNSFDDGVATKPRLLNPPLYLLLYLLPHLLWYLLPLKHTPTLLLLDGFLVVWCGVGEMITVITIAIAIIVILEIMVIIVVEE